MLASTLDAIGAQYGKLPHELMALGAEELGLAYMVMKRAQAARNTDGTQ